MWPDSDPVGSGNGKIRPVSPVPNQVCIISRDPLQAFIAALNPALRAREELTIIVDRRGAGVEDVAARPAIERRHHPSVDAKVKTDGFAIVPLSTTEDPQNPPPWIERLVDPPSARDDSEADELELQRILEFKRRHKARVGPLVRVSAIVGALSVLVILFVVLFVQMPVGKELVNRARLVALPTSQQTSERTPTPPSEPHTPSVVEAPVPPEPSRPPVERTDAPRDAVRTPTEVVSPPPSPRASASLQSKRRPANPQLALPARPQSVSEPADTAPTPRPDVAPPAPHRSLTVASPEPTNPPATAPEPARPTQNDSPRLRAAWPSTPWASAPDPTRSSEGSPPRTAPIASTPGEATASPRSAPRQPGARGFEAGIEALESHVTRDVNTAGVEAKRQIDELKAKAMKSLDEMRRVWNNATQVFSDKDANQAHGEAAAKPRK